MSSAPGPGQRLVTPKEISSFELNAYLIGVHTFHRTDGRLALLIYDMRIPR